MDFKTTISKKVFQFYKNEFLALAHNVYAKDYYLKRDYFWVYFIEWKDLGIKAVGLSDEYVIVDEKKWFVNKIKHGF